MKFLIVVDLSCRIKIEPVTKNKLLNTIETTTNKFINLFKQKNSMRTCSTTV